MARDERLRLGLAGALGALTFGGGLVMAGSLTWPTTWPIGLAPTAAVSEARAIEAAEATPADLELARRETLRTLSARPLDAMAWARLSWIADRQGDEASMLSALDRSYIAAPYEPEVTAWRLRFAFDRWGRLTPELRRQALSELAMTARTRPGVASRVERDVVDPSGRLAMALTASYARGG